MPVTSHVSDRRTEPFGESLCLRTSDIHLGVVLPHEKAAGDKFGIAQCHPSGSSSHEQLGDPRAQRATAPDRNPGSGVGRHRPFAVAAHGDLGALIVDVGPLHLRLLAVGGRGARAPSSGERLLRVGSKQTPSDEVPRCVLGTDRVGYRDDHMEVLVVVQSSNYATQQSLDLAPLIPIKLPADDRQEIGQTLAAAKRQVLGKDDKYARNKVGDQRAASTRRCRSDNRS